MQIGRRILFDTTTGQVITDFGEIDDGGTERNQMEYIDFPYGSHPELKVSGCRYHIDTATRIPVIDDLPVQQPTYEELQTMVEMLSEGVI